MGLKSMNFVTILSIYMMWMVDIVRQLFSSNVTVMRRQLERKSDDHRGDTKKTSHRAVISRSWSASRWHYRERLFTDVSSFNLLSWSQVLSDSFTAS